MKDFLGNDLAIGDDVIVIDRTRRYYISSVIRFTSQYVVIFDHRYTGMFRREGHQLIKVSKNMIQGGSHAEELLRCKPSMV